MAKGFSSNELIMIRKRLIKTAEETFSEKGLKKTSIEDLTSSVGIASGSFYKFFHMKEELFLEIIDQYNAEIFESIRDMMEEQLGVKKLDIEYLVMYIFNAYKEKTVYMLLLENNSEYNCLIKKLGKERTNETLYRYTEILRYLVEAVADDSRTAHRVNFDYVAGVLKYMFLALVNRNLMGKEVENIIEDNARLLARHVEQGKCIKFIE